MVKEKTVYSRVIEADIQMCRVGMEWEEFRMRNEGGGVLAGVMGRDVARKAFRRIPTRRT